MKWCCQQIAQYSQTTKHQGYLPKFPPNRTHCQKTGSLVFWRTRGSSHRQLLKVQLFFEISFILKIQLVLWFHHQMHLKNTKSFKNTSWQSVSDPSWWVSCCWEGSTESAPWPLPAILLPPNRRDPGQHRQKHTAGRLHCWDDQDAGGTGDSCRPPRVKSRCPRLGRRRGTSRPDNIGLSSLVKDATMQMVTFVFMECINAQVSQSCSANGHISPRGARFALYLASARPWNTICWVSRFWKLPRH